MRGGITQMKFNVSQSGQFMELIYTPWEGFGNLNPRALGLRSVTDMKAGAISGAIFCRLIYPRQFVLSLFHEHLQLL